MGGERIFAAGADIVQFQGGPNRYGPWPSQFRASFDKLAGLACPTIAAINGYALGGGAKWPWPAICGWRPTTPNSVNRKSCWAVIPGAGGDATVGPPGGGGRAKDLILSGRHVDAAEACASADRPGGPRSRSARHRPRPGGDAGRRSAPGPGRGQVAHRPRRRGPLETGPRRGGRNIRGPFCHGRTPPSGCVRSWSRDRERHVFGALGPLRGQAQVMQGHLDLVGQVTVGRHHPNREPMRPLGRHTSSPW